MTQEEELLSRLKTEGASLFFKEDLNIKVERFPNGTLKTVWIRLLRYPTTDLTWNAEGRDFIWDLDASSPLPEYATAALAEFVEVLQG